MNKPHPTDLDRPFPGVPVWQRYVGIGPIEEARQKICRMINRGEAIGVVMGPPGTGKTLLCQKIASLHRQSHEIVMLGDIRVTSRMGLVQQVLFHLGQPHQGKDEDALHLSLVQTLAKSSAASRTLLLVIDEAQMLSTDLLDEVRMLSNIVRDGRAMVQTVLVGGPRLEDTLADPQIDSLTQRIAARCYLHPLTHGECDQYIRTSMAALRLGIDDAAVAAVHHASGGIPRLVNQLMDLAIEVASTRRSATVDESSVQAAWAELQQLPSPVLEPTLKPRGGVIEFGELDGATFDFDNEKIAASQPAATAGHAVNELVADLRIAGADSGTAELEAVYTDIAAILQSASIDCLYQPETSPALTSWGEPRRTETQPSESPRSEQPPEVKVELKTTRTTIPIHAETTATDQELFGDNFDEELAVGYETTNFSSGNNEPSSDVPREFADVLAVVWNDEQEPVESIDDRDMLVIEDDVAVMVDSPEPSFVASGAMRKPTLKVVQSYQSLFSRLRGKQ